MRLEKTPEKLPEENWRGNPEDKNYYSFYRGKIPAIKDIDEIWTEAATQFIKNYEDDKPFCIFLPFMLPHPTYQIEEPYFTRIDRNALKNRIKAPENWKEKARIQKELARLQHLDDWSEAEFDELRAVYLGMCSKVDTLTGQVIEALKEKGIYDNTAVFFFSDHGDYTGDYGLVEKVQNCFEDCLTNVPFLVKLPMELQKRHGVSQELTELIDFYGTAEELAELPAEHTHFGHSLIPYIKKEQEALRTEVFCEGGFRKGEEHCKETGGQAVPDPRGLYYPRQFLQASDEMYNGKSVMCRTTQFKYIRRLYEQDEFYDLKRDPEERHNQIENPEYREVILDLKERLLQFYQDTCDVVPFQKDARMDRDFMKTIME